MQDEVMRYAQRLARNENQIIGRDGKYFITIQQLAGILELVQNENGKK